MRAVPSAGTSSPPRPISFRTSSAEGSRSSGEVTGTEVVPTRHAGPPGHDDVSVRRRPQAVDDAADEPVPGHEERAAAQDERDVDPGLCGDLPGPRSRGVDDDAAGDLAPLSGEQILENDSPDAPRAHGYRAQRMVREDHGSVLRRIHGIRQAQEEGIHGRIRHEECLPHLPGEARLPLERLTGTDVPCLDSRRRAGLRETAAVAGIVPLDPHEHPPARVDAVGRDAPEHAVLADALGRGLGILDHVPAAAVQQAVVAPARAVGNVALVHEGHARAPQRQVPSPPRHQSLQPL